MTVFDPPTHPITLRNVSLDPPTHPPQRYVFIVTKNHFRFTMWTRNIRASILKKRDSLQKWRSAGIGSFGGSVLNTNLVLIYTIACF